MKALINSMIDKVVKPIPKTDNIKDGQVYATHQGILKIGDIEMECFVLSDGKRIITEESMKKFFGDDFDQFLKLASAD